MGASCLIASDPRRLDLLRSRPYTLYPNHTAPPLQGGGLRDSFLVDGVAFKKTFSYAGFEMQPRAFTDPLILLLNIELELKAEKENAEVCAALSIRIVAWGPFRGVWGPLM